MDNQDEFISIYYDDDENYFVDIEGNFFCDIFRLITPNRLMWLKKHRGYEYVEKSGVTYEIVFPLYDEEYDYYEM